MKPRRELCVIALFSCASAILVPACSSRQERFEEKEQSYKVKVAPLVGNGTREKLVELFGIPANKITVEEQDVWAWHFRRRKTAEEPLLPKTSTVGNYEELTCTFDTKGILQSWRVTIPK